MTELLCGLCSQMGRKRKKDKASPNSNSDIQENKRTMASLGSYTSSPPGLTQTQASQYNSHIMPPTFNYTPNMCNNGASVMNMPQNYVQSPGAQGGPDQGVMNLILQRLDNMDKKLGQLDSIQTSISKITVKVNDIEGKLGALETKVRQIETSRDFDSASVDQLNRKQKEIDDLIKKMEKIEQEQVEKNQNVKAQMLDMQCRSMRDNLLFYRIPEARDESDADCVDKVLNLIEETMGIQNAKQEIKLHRAHRIGKYNPTKVRPIVAKFAYFPDREKVRMSAGKLKDTNYGISQQFPKEVMDKRRELVPIMKQARANGKDAYIVVDRLYINRVLYKPGATPTVTTAD